MLRYQNPGGAKMQSKPEAFAEGFDVILVTPERVLVSQHTCRPDAEGLISILKCLKAKVRLVETLEIALI
jgi:hypothetical protein